jgi:hypothetical protein
VDCQFLTGYSCPRLGWRQLPTIGEILALPPFVFFTACRATVFPQIDPATTEFDERLSGCLVKAVIWFISLRHFSAPCTTLLKK